MDEKKINRTAHPSEVANANRIRFVPREMALLIIGSIIYAAGVNLFIRPAGTYSGGVMGVTQLLQTFLEPAFPSIRNIPFISIVYYLLNLPLMFLAYKQLGKNFFVRTLICLTTESIVLSLIPTPDAMLVDTAVTSAICGGMVCGFGAGLIFLSRSSGGGLDIVGMVLTKKYQDISVGKISMGFNAVIYLICAVTQDISVAIYSIIYAAVSSIVIDKVHAQNICTEITVFTKKDPEEIIQYITRTIGRSANYWESTSGYTGDQNYVIYAVMSKYEVRRFEMFLHHYDPNIFAIKNHGVSIDGNFKKIL